MSNSNQGFCRKCGNFNDITQNIKLFKARQKGGKTSAEMINDLLDKFNNGEEIEKEDLKSLSLSDLNSYSAFSELSRKKKTDILSKIKKIDPRLFDKKEIDDEEERDNSPYYICYQCYHYEPITSGEVIYSVSLGGTEDQSDKIDNTHLIKDPTFLHTHTYICENKKCETHKNPELRDAIMTHTPQYNSQFICTVCKQSWTT